MRSNCAGCVKRPHVGARSDDRPHVGAHPTSGCTDANLEQVEQPIIATSKSAKFAEVEARTMAQRALIQLGWKAAIAKDAVDEAIKRVGVEIPLTELIREALKLCVGR